MSRAFMAHATSQTGDADSSRPAPGLNPGSAGSWMSSIVLFICEFYMFCVIVVNAIVEVR